MKKIFSLFVAASMAMTLSAQQTDKQVATLQHGDQTSVFYGIDAFKQAYDAAADTLDVITLSSGEFNGISDIQKSITVYGAGFEDDTINGIPKTYVKYISGITASGVHLEGMYIEAGSYAGIMVGFNAAANTLETNKSIYNLSFVKCHLPALRFGTDIYNCVVRQSYIYESIGDVNTDGTPTVMHNFHISNSYIHGQYLPIFMPWGMFSSNRFDCFDSSSTIWVDHCVLMGDMMEGPWHYTNNIIKDFWVGGHCNIYLGDGMPNMFDDNRNWLNVAPEYVWATEGEDGEYAEDKTFTIKLPELYIATDGTQIGLHGGTYAWNKIPSTPRIVECSIDTDNAANGTLKVSIKAEAQTKE